MAPEGMKAFSAAAERNRDLIAEVLARHLPSQGLVLEVASGTGQHAVHFGRRFPGVRWLPTDVGEAALRSIAAWRAESALPNVLPPRRLDVLAGPWPEERPDVIVAVNLVHISPWAVTGALLAGAAAALPPEGLLYLYGPYLRDGVVTAPSNFEFDAWLKSLSPEYGVRRLEDIVAGAEAVGLRFAELIEMPSNNCSVLFRR